MHCIKPISFSNLEYYIRRNIDDASLSLSSYFVIYLQPLPLSRHAHFIQTHITKSDILGNKKLQARPCVLEICSKSWKVHFNLLFRGLNEKMWSAQNSVQCYPSYEIYIWDIWPQATSTKSRLQQSYWRLSPSTKYTQMICRQIFSLSSIRNVSVVTW